MARFFAVIFTLALAFNICADESQCNQNPYWGNKENQSIKTQTIESLKTILNYSIVMCPHESNTLNAALSSLNEGLSSKSLLTSIQALVKNPSCSPGRYSLLLRPSGNTDLSFTGLQLNNFFEKRFGGVTGDFYKLYRIDIYRISQWKNFETLTDEVLEELKRPIQGLMHGLAFISENRLCIDDFCKYCKKQSVTCIECTQQSDLLFIPTVTPTEEHMCEQNGET